MLLVQNITLVWYKDSRGAPGGAVRARFPLAHPITKAASPLPPGEAVVHSLRFYQWSPEEIITNREECRRGLERHLPRLGFSREETAGRIARLQREMDRVQLLVYPDYTHLNLANLTFRPAGEGWEVGFWWDERRSGLPLRRGHNRDFHNPDSPLYCKDLLNETAFVLAPGQVGRLIWNERRQTCDDVTWYYQLHACSIVPLPGGVIPPDVFLAREPDFIYRQLAELY